MKLDGKVAVVTGGGRNIGRAISLLFASEGAKIAIYDADRGRAAAVAEEVEAAGGAATYVIGPVESPSAVEAMVETVAGRFGGIDVLVNCAAISDRQPVLELPDEEWAHILDVTLSGTYFCCKYVAKQMVAQGHGGTIVNFSSGSALKGNAGRIAYDVAKGGIISLTRDLAVQLAPHDIRTNAIAPGMPSSRARRYSAGRTTSTWAPMRFAFSS